MTSVISRAALLGAAFTLSFAALAIAAPAAAPEAGATTEKRVMVMRGGPGAPHGPMAMGHHDPEMHAQHLRDVLQLTPQQEPALKAFLEAAMPKMAMDRPASAPAAPLTTPQRLDRQAEMMARRHEAFARRAAAIKTFYAQLTPAQKKAFDTLHMMHGGRMGMGGMDRGGMGRRGMHHPGGAPMAPGDDDDGMEMP